MTSQNTIAPETTIALITGANKGLGRQTARRLGGLGWRVYLGSRDEERGKSAAADLADLGLAVEYLPLDVTSDESVAEAARVVGSRHGRLDVLINNAGITGPRRTPAETVPADFLGCYGVNVLGPVRVTHAFLPLLRAARQPRVVMVSSGMGSLTVTTDPQRLESSLVSLVYPSSKAALNMLTTQYAKGFPDIQFNLADPGYTATDLNGHTGLQSVEEGTDAIVGLATAAPGTTGMFLDRHGVVPW